jgi:hypothetical protein
MVYNTGGQNTRRLQAVYFITETVRVSAFLHLINFRVT